jgi:hypothetical protein
MANNIDQNHKTLENSKNKLDEISDRNIPKVESDKIIEEKETHVKNHHYHTNRSSRKTIWNYLFDFLMLFLAVFCGFIADNWREQLSEHQREKEFIHSIVEDIKSDTLQSNKILGQLKGMSAGIDTVLIMLSSHEIIENSNKVYRLWSKNMGLQVFVSNDRTIEQLKNSGELRLIRKKAVSDRIMQYDQTLKKYYVQSNLMYNALDNITYYSQLFDFINLNKDQSKQVPLTEQGKKLLNQSYGNLLLWNKGLLGLISWLEDVNKEGKKLVIFIQKEYHM